MKWVDADSSLIEQYGYDEDARTLYIIFKRGATYTYSGVPPEVFEEMQGAESTGKFFIANVKGSYECLKRED